MKTTLNIESHEDKTSQAGKKYTRFKTSEGWMSCFNKETIEELKKNEGKDINVEVQESGEYKNIKKLYADGEAPVKKPGSAPERKVNDFRERQEENKQAGVAMSYAVDLAIAGKLREGETIYSTARELLENMKKLAVFN